MDAIEISKTTLTHYSIEKIKKNNQRSCNKINIKNINNFPKAKHKYKTKVLVRSELQ